MTHEWPQSLTVSKGNNPASTICVHDLLPSCQNGRKPGIKAKQAAEKRCQSSSTFYGKCEGFTSGTKLKIKCPVFQIPEVT